MKTTHIRRSSPAFLTLPLRHTEPPPVPRRVANPGCAILIVSLALWTALFFAGWAIGRIIAAIS